MVYFDTLTTPYLQAQVAKMNGPLTVSEIVADGALPISATSVHINGTPGTLYTRGYTVVSNGGLVRPFFQFSNDTNGPTAAELRDCICLFNSDTLAVRVDCTNDKGYSASGIISTFGLEQDGDFVCCDQIYNKLGATGTYVFQFPGATGVTVEGAAEDTMSPHRLTFIRTSPTTVTVVRGS